MVKQAFQIFRTSADQSATSSVIVEEPPRAMVALQWNFTGQPAGSE